MKEDIISKDIKEVDYQILRQIEEHAKKYEQASDKKNFLRNVSAYEQKIILLNSLRPYEVLMYLDELDLKSSRLVISELTHEEISKILALFTSEDKKNFYKLFSDLSLVNEFIKYDSNSSEHIQSLSFERKFDILESTKEETIEASSKIYESMSSKEQEIALENITGAEASNVLNDVASDDFIQNEQNNSNDDIEIKNIEDESKEQTIDYKQMSNDKNNFIKDNLQKYMEKIPELSKFNIDSDDIYELLSEESKNLIDNEFDLNNTEIKEQELINNLDNDIDKQDNLEINDILEKQDNKEEVNSTESIVNQFEQAKKECEQQEIEMIKSQIVIDNQKTMEKKI